MASGLLAKSAQHLSSLDHAILLSLIGKQHCLIQTDLESIDDVADEIQLTATQLFGLSHVILDCHSNTSLEEFSRSILVETRSEDDITSTISNTEADPLLRRTSSYTIPKPQTSADWGIASVLVLKNLDTCSQQIQIQVLELIRTHRVFTHNGVYSAPKTFLIVMVSSISMKLLNIHLNDMIFLSHFHDSLDGFPRLFARREARSTSPSTDSSILRSSSRVQPQKPKSILIPANQLQQLSLLPALMTMTSEVRSYLVSVTIFLRTHRALMPGSATPLATRHLDLLSRCLALLHDQDFVTPALIALAARKVYRHRLKILRPDDAAWDRTVMYGSREKDVQGLLKEMWAGTQGETEVAEQVLDSIMDSIEVPV